MACSYMKIILTDWLGNPNCNVQTRLVPKAHLPLIFSTVYDNKKVFYNKWSKRDFFQWVQINGKLLFNISLFGVHKRKWILEDHGF